MNQIPHQPDDNRMIGSLLQHPIVIVFERTGFDCDRSNDSKRPCDLFIVAGKRRLIDDCVIFRWPRDAARPRGIEEVDVGINDRNYDRGCVKSSV